MGGPFDGRLINLIVNCFGPLTRGETLAKFMTDYLVTSRFQNLLARTNFSLPILRSIEKISNFLFNSQLNYVHLPFINIGIYHEDPCSVEI